MRTLKPKRNKPREVHRSYTLKLYGNKAKVDTARYSQVKFNQYCNMFLGPLFFGKRKISTVGMGDLASKALNRSFEIIKKQRAATRATQQKANVPYAQKQGCYAKIYPSKSSFDYWVNVPNLWSKFGFVSLPAKSHRKLNEALRSDWKLSPYCEFKIINGNAYAVVFVSKERPKIRKPKDTIGCDVGYKYSVCRSDGHIGQNISKVIRRSKQIQSERRRQRHKISCKTKTAVKQILDLEAKKALRRSQSFSARLVVESQKRLAGLSTGRLHGWARGYFANRLKTLGQENGVEVIEVNPYQTSMTCFKCKAIDKQSRDKQAFKCTSCGHTDHADVNAAKNIASKATATSERVNSDQVVRIIRRISHAKSM